MKILPNSAKSTKRGLEYIESHNKIYLEVIDMDIKRKKELIQSWKDRTPEMGIISFKCMSTGEEFLAISRDIKADFNSNRFQLNLGKHPNKNLNNIWKKYGEDDFKLYVVEELEEKFIQEKTKTEVEEKLEELFEKSLEKIPSSNKIRK